MVRKRDALIFQLDELTMERFSKVEDPIDQEEEEKSMYYEYLHQRSVPRRLVVVHLSHKVALRQYVALLPS